MNKPVRIILLGEADEELNKLNIIVGEQMQRGKRLVKRCNF